MSGKSEIIKVRIRHLEFMDKICIHSSGKMIYYLNEHSWFARVNPFKTVSMEKNQSGFSGRRVSLATKTLEMELVPEGAGMQHSLLTALPCCLLDCPQQPHHLPRKAFHVQLERQGKRDACCLCWFMLGLSVIRTHS